MNRRTLLSNGNAGYALNIGAKESQCFAKQRKRMVRFEYRREGSASQRNASEQLGYDRNVRRGIAIRCRDKQRL